MQNMRTDRKKTDREQVSLQRIAQECNVSLMTVSRALRRLPSVAEETRKKVFEVAEQLGYLRSGRAGRKADKREELHCRPVQIIAGETSAGMPRFHAELVLDLVRRLAACRYECVIRVSDGSYREFTRVLANASRADAEASIIVGSFTEKELRSLLAALPGAILVEDTDKSFYESTYSSFSFDNERAAALAVNRFLKTKREKILLVSGPEDHFFTRELAGGYRKALKAAGKKVEEKYILYTDFTPECAEKVVGDLWDSGERFDAVFTNDEMAGGVYRALLSRSLKIPEDVGVCGCDGLPLGEQFYPRLTTVVLDHRLLACQVVEKITSGDLARNPVSVRLIPSLVLRESL